MVWTSGVANWKANCIKWCSTNQTNPITKDMPIQNAQSAKKNKCVVYHAYKDAFLDVDCNSKFPYVCEVSIKFNAINICKYNHFLKAKCVTAMCPMNAVCKRNVLFQYFLFIELNVNLQIFPQSSLFETLKNNATQLRS